MIAVSINNYAVFITILITIILFLILFYYFFYYNMGVLNEKMRKTPILY
jgi:hypothetical protein